MVINRNIFLLPIIVCFLFGIAPSRSSGANIVYIYDSLNRVTNVNYGNGSVISYTYDPAGNRLTYSGAVANDLILPTISITNPTSGPSFTTSNATVNLSGTASDNTAVSLITWANNRGGIGTATGTNSWNINGVHLQNGANEISVTAYDAAGNNTDATLTVTYFPPPVLRITGLTITSDTSALLAGVGPAAGIVFIQTSTNLTRWQTIAILTNVTGAFQFPYPISKSESKRFFRAMPPSAVAPSPQIRDMRSSAGMFRFSLNGLWGDSYVVQASTNLINWVSISTNVIPAGGFIIISDPNMFTNPRRFFRAVPTDAATSVTNMALIPAGSFQMGDSFLDGDSFALPLHTVYVSAIYMDKYEVTKALWDDVKGWNGGNGYVYDKPGLGKAPSHPVQTVSWYDVVKWCNARSQKEGRTPAYYTDAALTQVYKTGQVAPYVNWNSGYRLPTEAEWEKAARGGASGQRFPWGNTINQSRANYYSYWSGGVPYYPYDVNPTSGYHPTFAVGGSPYTSPVGDFAPNGYGLYDMAGNVWEWCWDWSGAYSSGSQTDPRGPATSSSRVIRGGSWDRYGGVCRSAVRLSSDPPLGDVHVGFRSVVPPGQ